MNTCIFSQFQEFCSKFGYIYDKNVLLIQRGPLSNFWGGFKGQKCSITSEIQINPNDWDTIAFNTSEQNYMACKAEFFQDWETLDLIRKEKHPRIQRELGQHVLGFITEQWNKNKFNIMLNINRAKFQQNKELRDYLVSVPKHCIITESTTDLEWGTGLDIDHPDASDVSKWTGKNLMGRVLMQIRQEYD